MTEITLATKPETTALNGFESIKPLDGSVDRQILASVERLHSSPGIPISLLLDMNTPTHRRALEAMIRVMDSAEDKKE